jgi:glycosyltransferase involved in cell wall biosynthesis
MKLLIVTQTLDSKHSVLGFFVRWVLEFSKQCEQVTVFCLDKGEDVFPSNVEVVPISRTWHGLKIWPLILAYRVLVYRKKYTHVFAHMNPEYIISAGIIWRLLGKKISLWYAHGTVSLRLKIATAFCHRVFSSTHEGFRYPTRKLHIVGQGMDLNLYQGVNLERGLRTPISLASIGRISSSKRLELLLETVVILKSRHIDVVCTIIGGPLTDVDKKYLETLEGYIRERGLADNVIWKGALPLTEAITILKETDVFVHFGNTGSLDKAVLDAMACGVIPLSANEAVKNVLQDIDQNLLVLADSQDAAAKVEYLVGQTQQDITVLRTKMAGCVQTRFSLEIFVTRIIGILNNKSIL